MMFSYISGKLVIVMPEYAIVDVQGIGYRINLAPNYFSRLPQAPASITLHVSFVIREFSQALYGFLEEAERDIFDRLLDISGVGPKLSLSIVGHLTPYDLKEALITKDVSLLCKVPGIGKKTAERLLLELKESHLAYHPTTSTQLSVRSPPLLQDAISALINLGYNQQVAHKAVTATLESFSEPPELTMLITMSLRNIK